jgi:hypothetical protein
VRRRFQEGVCNVDVDTVVKGPKPLGSPSATSATALAAAGATSTRKGQRHCLPLLHSLAQQVRSRRAGATGSRHGGREPVSGRLACGEGRERAGRLVMDMAGSLRQGRVALRGGAAYDLGAWAAGISDGGGGWRRDWARELRVVRGCSHDCRGRREQGHRDWCRLLALTSRHNNPRVLAGRLCGTSPSKDRALHWKRKNLLLSGLLGLFAAPCARGRQPEIPESGGEQLSTTVPKGWQGGGGRAWQDTNYLGGGMLGCQVAGGARRAALQQ